MELVDAEELAKRLSVPRSQVYRQVELGRWPVVKVGRYYRFPWPAILEHLSGGAFHFPEVKDDDQRGS